MQAAACAAESADFRAPLLGRAIIHAISTPIFRTWSNRGFPGIGLARCLVPAICQGSHVRCEARDDLPAGVAHANAGKNRSHQ
jgi:hypothetical protein